MAFPKTIKIQRLAKGTDGSNIVDSLTRGANQLANPSNRPRAA